MLVKKGEYCDVCGERILLIAHESREFRVDQIKETLYCHKRCIPALQAAQGDWSKLPHGPLRTAFERDDAARQLLIKEVE